MQRGPLPRIFRQCACGTDRRCGYLVPAHQRPVFRRWFGKAAADAACEAGRLPDSDVQCRRLGSREVRLCFPVCRPVCAWLRFDRPAADRARFPGVIHVVLRIEVYRCTGDDGRAGERFAFAAVRSGCERAGDPCCAYRICGRPAATGEICGQIFDKIYLTGV